MGPEKRHLLKYVMLLSAELERIKGISNYATAFGETVIEQIIEGNYKEVEMYLKEMLDFTDVDRQVPGDDNKEGVCSYVQLWFKFRTFTQEAIDTRPANEVAGDTKH